MRLEILRFIHFIFDTFLIIYFFNSIEPIRKPNFLQKAEAFFSILSLLILYYSFPNLLFRLIYRVFAATIYLKLHKGLNWRKAGYFSGLCCTAYYIHQTIFFTPLLSPFLANEVNCTSYLTINTLITQTLVYGSCFLIYTLIRRMIRFNEIGHIGYSRPVILLTIAICNMYVRYSLILISNDNLLQRIEITVFPILLQFFLIATIVCFENYLLERKKQEEIYFQEITNAYKLENLRNLQSREEDLRLLSHDMKNHLLAIRQLSHENNDQIETYINGLLGELNKQIQYIETGNQLLNGLLSEKMAEGAKDNIAFSIVMDFRSITFIADMDLCAIFGNALDNSIEASHKVKNPAERYISIRSTCAASQLIISIANRYSNKLNLVNGIPATTKPSSMMHGKGLSNIRRTLNKYKGTMSVNINSKHTFVLLLMIPLPDLQSSPISGDTH